MFCINTTMPLLAGMMALGFARQQSKDEACSTLWPGRRRRPARHSLVLVRFRGDAPALLSA